jgi:sec-independent protein translocase protein TatA
MDAMGVDLLTPTHLIFLALLALLLFGPKRLPEIGRSLGNGIREFKGSIDGIGMSDALRGANEIRSAVTPTNVARAAIPGVAEAQDTIATAKDLAQPGIQESDGAGAVASEAGDGAETPVAAPQPPAP